MRSVFCRTWDIVIAFALMAASVTLTLFAPVSFPLRPIIATPTLLFVPGYMVIAALIPRSSQIGLANGLLYSLGLNLMLLVIIGFALNFTPWGIQSTSWALALGAVVIVAGVVTLIRRLNHPGGATPRIKLPLRSVALYATTLVLATAAMVVARHSAASEQPAFTQLWIEPSAPGSGTTTIGIRSYEQIPMTYRVELTLDGDFYQSIPLLRLGPGEEWATPITVPPGPGTLTATVYRVDQPAVPYRQVELRLPVAGTS